PRVRNRKREQTGQPLRRAKRQPKPDEGPPIVPDIAHPRQSKSVEQGEEVVNELALVIAAGWCVRESEATQIGHDAAVSVTELLGDTPPTPGVLGAIRARAEAVRHLQGRTP